jgi:C4-dicarboxylate-specific signal transduction histidine kinase/ActR/RegA family two-component response regulator
MTSIRDALLRHGSLGRRLLLVSAFQALVLLVSLVVLLRMTMDTRFDMEQATTAYLEEQAIADRITTAVTRQLATAAASLTQSDPAFREDFSSAGEDAYVEIRRYLFRDLSAEQRLQLETVREQHQRMEVTAARAIELADRGRTEDAGDAVDAMITHGLALQAVLGDFLRIRQADMARLADRQAAVFRFLQVSVVAVAVLVLLAIGLMARFLYGRLATPLSELAGAAHRIGAGDLTTRVHLPREDELAALARAFNDMADGLADAHRDLEDRNRQLESALDQLRSAQAELVQTEKLSAMGRMMAGLAHELNNPLASVLGYGQLALDRNTDPDPLGSDELLREYVAPIVAEAQRARQLVHDLLGFAREAEPVASGASLREVVETAVRMQAYAFDQAGLAIQVGELPDVRVRAEPQRLQQSLLTVIRNAYEAMLPLGAGALAISARVEAARVVVVFQDDGPGIPAVDLVFEPFYTTKPAGEGIGLGLALVHRFMAEIGGTIMAENRAEGGARFILSFRLADASGTPSAPVSSIPRFRVTESGVERASPGLSGRILVVEDEAPLRKLQTRVLRRLGATVVAAEHGLEARRILEEGDVDLVISDVKMPGGSGLALYRWIEEERPHLLDRFLFVTGHPGEGEAAALAEERADRFMYKPFDMAEYVARVTSLLDQGTAE